MAAVILASRVVNAEAARSQGGALTLLFIAIVLTSVGAILVFNLRGFASKSYQSNTAFTPWGRRLAARDRFPNPYIMVGWAFFVPGVGLLLLATVSLIAR